jgi:hypothetical protein
MHELRRNQPNAHYGYQPNGVMIAKPHPPPALGNAARSVSCWLPAAAGRRKIRGVKTANQFILTRPRSGEDAVGARYVTIKGSNGWAVKKEGTARISSTHNSQADAWAEARRLARGSGGDAVLRGTDGHVRATNAYGKDPFFPKG